MIHYNIYKSFKNLPEGWNSIVNHDVFLQLEYLNALEEASPENIQWFYIGIFKDNLLVGVAIVQRVQLYLKDIFRQTKISCVKTFFQDVVSKVLKGNILVVGNLMHTGQHGIFFNKEIISKTQFFEAVFSALSEIKTNIKKNQKKRIRAIMLKDYFDNDSIHNEIEIFNSAKLHKVFVQPNMILFMQPEWLKKEDYTASLTKKYRDRYKRARKKLNSIKSVELNVDDIKRHTADLHGLYMNVSNNAQFNTFLLPENHFYSLKLQLQDRFKVYGYYLKDTLVGFYTLILNNEALETYFLGYDEEHQYPNQLYLNMLYDMLNFGIDNKFKTIVYARTAMEIKSSVGAEAKPMVVYMKHTNGFLNAILKQLFKLMNPSQDWEERHPFKTKKT
ncbi:Acetyltransferase (GNAT) domain-containing protein [Flaviramulus basaltis]|uniref:Acetyltransferase (GNAT) domain-containing protein n=1 Tax=Flaviramulus basaltis TaxID=369401 RepID=A0A1K2ICL2_9FLAO|nr:GNAT family N-acetyltransferase [Flaviramulus basaltis]SFZ90172.1 Acetyltransferase (GNAT) domain-containing protein [Flaviramulus basaltis]